MYVFFIKKATGTPFFDKAFHSFKEPAHAGSFFAVRRTADRVLGRSVANMRKRVVSGIRDLWIVLFCLTERTLLQILLAVPVPVRMVLAGVLAAKYVECLFCTSLSMTILTVVMTVFVATNIKKWNAEFQIIYAMARIRKRSRKKVYNFI